MLFLPCVNAISLPTCRFCKLFLSYIEDKFSKSDNPLVKTLVDSEFSGSLEYEVKCSECSTCSKSSSPFHEIPLIVKVRPTILSY